MSNTTPQELERMKLQAAADRKELLAEAAGSEEMPYEEIERFVLRLMDEPRGQQRAANLIGTLARCLAERGDTEGLDHALKQVTAEYRFCFQSLLENTQND